VTAKSSGGSVWRRWDPHVHLPGTLLNDQFGTLTIEAALDVLAGCAPAIEALGITDYFSTESFRAASTAWKSGAGAGILYLFPNVEMRLDVPTARGSGINLHVLSAPEDVDGLDRMLGSLTFTYTDRDYRADRAGLISLGRDFRREPSLEEGAALREGANQFKVNFDQLRGLFQRDIWFREHFLVAVAGGQADGTSGLRSADGGFAARRQSIERFAQIVLSGNESQREFWLGRGTDSREIIVDKYKGLKLCLHGSDAHAFEKLGKPDQDRFTWVKGDPRFDTLRLACLAPETRSQIGSVDPRTGNEHGRISSVTINDESWFTEGTVPINTGLVAIIGARGSGKTALADLIAVGAGSGQPFDNGASFVSRAGRLLHGSRSTVQWSDDDKTEHGLFGAYSADPWLERRVRYLSQQFVERLCASDGVSDELLVEIERVIFNAWPVDERQGATDFQELLGIRLGALRARQKTELETIRQIGEAITDQRVIKSGLARKQEERKGVGTSIAALEAQINTLTAKSGGTSGVRHGLVSSVLASRQEALQAVDRRITDIKALQDGVDTALGTHFPQFLRRLREPHPYAGLSETEWGAFLPRFGGDVRGILQDRYSSCRAQGEHAALAGA
jgi:hypothetical protein